MGLRTRPASGESTIDRSYLDRDQSRDRSGTIMGEAPGLHGFYITVTANGYTLGPVVGQITAEAIRPGEPIDPRYTLARFK